MKMLRTRIVCGRVDRMPKQLLECESSPISREACRTLPDFKQPSSYADNRLSLLEVLES